MMKDLLCTLKFKTAVIVKSPSLLTKAVTVVLLPASPSIAQNYITKYCRERNYLSSKSQMKMLF